MQDDFGHEISPRRRKSDAELEELSSRMDALEVGLAANTTTTQRIDRNTAELVEMFQNAKGFFAVLEAVGKLAKPIIWLGAMISLAGLGWQQFKSNAHQFFR